MEKHPDGASPRKLPQFQPRDVQVVQPVPKCPRENNGAVQGHLGGKSGSRGCPIGSVIRARALSGSSYANVAHSAIYVQGNLVTASTGVPPTCRAPHGSQTIPGELPPAINNGTVPLVGSLSPAATLKLALGLPLQNQAGLQSSIQQIYDPKSTQYHKYLTPTQFGNSYGVSQTDYNSVVSYVQSHGLNVLQTYSGRHILAVSGTVAAIEGAFYVTLNQYQLPDGTIFYAPANEPSADLSVPILHISGLDSYAQPQHNNSGGSGPTCNFGPAFPGYGGSDFRNIYLGSSCSGLSSLDGTGQTVALYERSDYNNQDITDYVTFFSLPTPNVSRVQVPRSASPPALPTPLSGNCSNLGTYYSGVAATGCGSAVETYYTAYNTPLTAGQQLQRDAGGESEVALDIEMVLAMAPKAQVLVYEQISDNTNGEGDVILAQMADENLAKVISISWFWYAATYNPIIANIFQQFAVQGQSVFVASGDAGSAIPSGLTNYTNVPDPMIDSSLMTTVGGTTLSTSGSGATLAYASETTWNDYSYAPGSRVVSTGGFCTGYNTSLGSPIPTLPIPSYQLNVNSSNSEVVNNPQNARMIPDVAMVADDIWTYFELFERTSTKSLAGHGMGSRGRLSDGNERVGTAMGRLGGFD